MNLAKSLVCLMATISLSSMADSQPTNDPSSLFNTAQNLIPHGDFETENRFKFPSNSEGVANLNNQSPISGRQSVQVNFTNFSVYSPFNYSYKFPENTRLESLSFNGLVQMISGYETESLIAEAHVTYHSNGHYPFTHERVIISGNNNATTFNVNVPLDQSRTIKHVDLKFLYVQNQQDLTVSLDNLALYVVPAGKENLISHGDFETENRFRFPSASEGTSQITRENPLAGQQSLEVNFTAFSAYSPFYYSYQFPENTQLESLQFSGLLKMIEGFETESLVAEAHVTYHRNGQYPLTHRRVAISGNGDAVNQFTVNVPLDKNRKIKHVDLKFLYTQNQQDLTVLLDNLALYVEPKDLSNLIEHGDFENENLFNFPSNSSSTAYLTADSPISGEQSALVNFTDFDVYSPFNHAYQFTENTYLNSLRFSGKLQTISGYDTESVIAEAHVTYHESDQYPFTHERVTLSNLGNSVTSFNVDLPLDNRRPIKHVDLKFLHFKNQNGLSILLDDLALTVDPAH
ncbi:hypothetical protein [Pseudoalteromonas obscura]|uniref:Uncharacterized protein n=1 Tax=Pseudoalteromonas obscura TaxID=3048491 RepID=A0ABT7EJ11_9GAMM|nr:hypothetical protein [Pseudoalteromonas sp. P94(2023)]MDK2595008.1 hypothetical protein [Pseudoalteromonas sp. P94(2023)]